MYKFSEIKTLHIELTSNCQAKCPMCARNYHGFIDNPYLSVKSLDFNFVKNILSDEFIKQLEYLNLCSNFGEPILYKDLIPLIEYISSINPDLMIDIHTNGSARSAEWWRKLAFVLPKNSIVHFGIDGLEDTHHLHRIGTDYKKIIENAKEFIKAGGRARWNFITFKHNEHQLEDCKTVAKELGFDSFYEKQSNRFIGNPWFDVLDKEGNLIYRLENPTNQQMVVVDKETVKNYKEVIKSAVIECEVETTKSIYIDSQGHLWPCAWMGAVPYIYIKPDDITYDFQKENHQTLLDRIELFGGKDALDLTKHTIKDIIDSPAWQTLWNDGFEKKTPLVCIRVCGKFNKPIIGQCKDQFINLDNFNN